MLSANNPKASATRWNAATPTPWSKLALSPGVGLVCGKCGKCLSDDVGHEGCSYTHKYRREDCREKEETSIAGREVGEQEED